MSRTPIPEHLKHDLKKVETNGQLFDEITDLVPSWSEDTRAEFSSFWIETIRAELVGKITLRLDKNLFPAEVGLCGLRYKILSKKFAKVLSKKVNRKIDAMILPFGMVLLKDSNGYYVSHLYS